MPEVRVVMWQGWGVPYLYSDCHFRRGWEPLTVRQSHEDEGNPLGEGDLQTTGIVHLQDSSEVPDLDLKEDQQCPEGPLRTFNGPTPLHSRWPLHWWLGAEMALARAELKVLPHHCSRLSCGTTQNISPRPVSIGKHLLPILAFSRTKASISGPLTVQDLSYMGRCPPLKVLLQPHWTQALVWGALCSLLWS